MFSLFDGTDYLNTGLNSATKEECVNAGIDFYYDFYEDNEPGQKLYDVLSKTATIEQKENMLLSGFDVIVEEHTHTLYEF